MAEAMAEHEREEGREEMMSMMNFDLSLTSSHLYRAYPPTSPISHSPFPFPPHREARRFPRLRQQPSSSLDAIHPCDIWSAERPVVCAPASTQSRIAAVLCV